ncbi:hypothetical protein K200098A10_20620 [Flavonifractor plautii]
MQSGSHPSIKQPVAGCFALRRDSQESCPTLAGNPVMILLSSHSRKQWGQLGEILGGVRFP